LYSLLLNDQSAKNVIYKRGNLKSKLIIQLETKLEVMTFTQRFYYNHYKGHGILLL